MQGTVVMLMALSGLGCHNKSCDVAYAPPAYSCFSGGCYANVYPPDYVSPSCYSGCYSSGYSGCYSASFGGCYGGCYSGSYGGHHGCGLFAKLFSCFNHSGRGCYGSGYGCYGGGFGCFGGCYGDSSYDAPYSPAIYGYALQYNYGSMDSNQGPSSTMSPGMTPSEAVAPVAPNPVPPSPAPSTPAPPEATPPAPPPAATPAIVAPPLPAAPATVVPAEPAPKPSA
jgi:hypothetical protein